MAKRKTSLGCLFWIALILLVLVVFFFNRQRITRVLEETGFSTYLSTQEEEEPTVKRKTVEDEKEPEEQETQEDTIRVTPGGDEDEKNDPPVDESSGKEKKEVEETSADRQEPKIEKKLRKSTVYFVSVHDDGSISLRRIVRPVYYDDSPLTATLNTLLEGLTPAELNEGLLNLIPDNTQIHRVWIENGTAYIDFSEDLRFNRFGAEGIRAALKQIVYTATEFSTVDSVQILINGEKRTYLSPEGIPVSAPISRGDIETGA